MSIFEKEEEEEEALTFIRNSDRAPKKGFSQNVTFSNQKGFFSFGRDNINSFYE